MISSFKNKSLSQCLELIRENEMTWIAKRLSGNDTGLTGGHQAGVYLPKNFIKETLSEINTTSAYNPRTKFRCLFPINGSDSFELTAIYYNSKYATRLDSEERNRGTRNEFRITGWGGRASPAQNPENAGCVFLFAISPKGSDTQAIALVAENLTDEKIIEDWLGREVEPGMFLSSDDSTRILPLQRDIPKEWLGTFPSGGEIFDYVTAKLPRASWKNSLDELLLKRRILEFEVFSEVESVHVFPRIKVGFADVESFVALALSVANRRKSRTGTSLELNLAAIFRDEKILFEAQALTENKKRPDFLFPGGAEYRNSSFPSAQLTMLAAKTCCKDRWRQVLSEADRLSEKHLFTLQEGVSSNQLEEMAAKQLTLVVPEPNLGSFPSDWRSRIFTLSSFISTVRDKQSYL